MNDAFPVSGVEGITNLRAIFQRLIQWQRSAKRLALDVLHDEIVRTDIVKLTDMRMIERSDCPGFALESFVELLTRSLDGDDAIEPCVACLPHFTHSARADLREDLIRSEM